MKLFNKIKAFFKYKGEEAEVEASAVEIHDGYVYLHSVEDPSQVRRIRSNAVDIFISPNENISEDDIEFFERKRKSSSEEQVPSDEEKSNIPSPSKEQEVNVNTPLHVPESYPENSGLNTAATPYTTDHHRYQRPQMRKVSFTLYPDEYEMLMSNIKEKGYKKTEFLLACVTSAKKNSMESAYRKLKNSRYERRLAEREARRNSEFEGHNAG